MLSSYSHHYHAGNIGDVWKHTVLHTVLREAMAAHGHVRVLECHGGAGIYALQSTGEWTAGIGMFSSGVADAAPHGLRDCMHTLRALGWDPPAQRKYAGSPLQFAHLLRNTDTLTVCEHDLDTFNALQRVLPQPHTALHTDGMRTLLEYARDDHAGYTMAHIDPPWTHKSDWTDIPEQLLQAHKASPNMGLAMWYPIKSYTRVSAMLKHLTAQGLPAVALDLITTPLHYQRARLNGSGMLLVNVSREVVSECLAAGAYIGEECATRGRYFHIQATRLV